MHYHGVFAIIAISALLLNVNLIFSESTEPTKLKLHKMRTSFVDGAKPLVFVGKLTTTSGEPIYNATIYIKNNQDCPSDQIVGQALTDKTGKFYVYTVTKVWSAETNRITFHAEFYGDENYSSSISEERTYVIFPKLAEKCEN